MNLELLIGKGNLLYLFMSNILGYTVLFFVVVIVSYNLGNYLRRISLKAKVDFNKKLKDTSPRWRKSNKPLVGGLVFIIITLISALFYFLYVLEHDVSFNWYTSEVSAFLLGVTIGFVGGLYDDVNYLPPLVKASIQLLVGVIFLINNVKINLLPWEPINIFLTLFWVVGIMNSINMLDNMDGVAGALALTIITAAMVIEVVFFQNNWWLFMWVVLSATLIGYLLLNKPPAKIYMGDSGSQFLGAVISFIGLKYFWQLSDTPKWSNILLIFWAALPFIILISDTTLVVIRRILSKQSPIVGGKDHISHMLILQGITEKRIFILLSVINTIGIIIYFLTIAIPDDYRITFSFFMFLLLFTINAYLYIKNYKHSEYYKPSKIKAD